MTYKQFLAAALLVVFSACKKDYFPNKIEAERLEINDSLKADEAIEAFVKPFREHVNSDLDSVLAHAVATYDKRDGEGSTAIGNLMADIVYEQGNKVYMSRTNKGIDMVMLNHGGIRAIISQGHVTARTAFEVMPFENSIVVSELSGNLIKQELIPYLLEAKRAHPISQLKLVVDADYNLLEASIKGQSIEDDRVYHVATSDYLYFGGDRMHFFKKGDSTHVLDYKIRNALIDYFKKVDTINPVRDDRFTIKN